MGVIFYLMYRFNAKTQISYVEYFLVLTLVFQLGLLIIFNKDYFLNKVSNKYIKMYAKYVLLKTKFNLIFEALIIVLTLLAIAYFLHYLITHPIITS